MHNSYTVCQTTITWPIKETRMFKKLLSTSQEDVDLSHAQFILVITLNVKNDLHEDKENGN